MAVTVAVKKAVIERDGGFCLLALPGCLGEAQTTDHRANRGSGGSPILDDPRNLVAACTLCNGAKADGHQIVLTNLADRGLYIRKAATNAQTLTVAINTPVEALDGQLWLLLTATERRRYEASSSD